MKRIWLFVALGLSTVAHADSWKFDMGPESSPVKDGYTLVEKGTVYSSQAGLGWSSGCEKDFDRENAMYPRFATDYTRAQVTEPATDLTIDGVASADDIGFRVDLPNGKYWVMAFVGDLGKPTFKTALSANGKLISNKVDAFAYRDRGTFANPAIAGAVVRSRFYVDVTDGKLDLLFHKAEGRKNPYAEIGAKPAADSRGRMKKGGEGGAAEFVDDLMPFTRNAVLGIEIYSCPSYEERPFYMAGGELETTAPGADRLTDCFNDKLFEEAMDLLDEAQTKDEYPLAFASAYLWLAGRPEVENYRELVTEARSLLEGYLETDPDNAAALDLYANAWLFDTAMLLRDQKYKEVGVLGMRSLEGVHLAEQMLRQLTESDPLYYSALIERARISCGLDPNQGNERFHYGHKIFKDLQ